jgi:hypothetical protein
MGGEKRFGRWSYKRAIFSYTRNGARPIDAVAFSLDHRLVTGRATANRRPVKPGHRRVQEGVRMKSILDPTFRYVPSVQTDVRKTFARIRRELRAADAKPGVEAPAVANVLSLQRRQPLASAAR